MGRFFYPIVFLVALTAFALGGSIQATFFSPQNLQLTNEFVKAEPNNEAGQIALQETNGQCERRPFAERLLCDPTAYFTKGLAYVTGVLVLVTGILAAFTASLYMATVNLGKDARKSGKKQSKITRQMFLAEHRPWIAVKPSIASDLTYDEEGNAWIAIQFVATNVGKGPAIGVMVEANLHIVSGNEQSLQRQFIEQMKLFPQRIKEFGFTLFPSEPLVYTYKLHITKNDMTDFSRNWAEMTKTKEERTAFSISLIGCVIYGFTFEDGVHQTGFIFDLDKRDPQNPNINLMIDTKDGPIPASLLKLSHTRFGMPPD